MEFPLQKLRQTIALARQLSMAIKWTPNNIPDFKVASKAEADGWDGVNKALDVLDHRLRIAELDRYTIEQLIKAWGEGRSPNNIFRQYAAEILELNNEASMLMHAKLHDEHPEDYEPPEGDEA